MATKTEFGGPEVKVGIALASTTRTPGTPRILNVNVRGSTFCSARLGLIY